MLAADEPSMRRCTRAELSHTRAEELSGGISVQRTDSRPVRIISSPPLRSLHRGYVLFVLRTVASSQEGGLWLGARETGGCAYRVCVAPPSPISFLTIILKLSRCPQPSFPETPPSSSSLLRRSLLLELLIVVVAIVLILLVLSSTVVHRLVLFCSTRYSQVKDAGSPVLTVALTHTNNNLNPQPCLPTRTTSPRPKMAPVPISAPRSRP